MPATPLDLAIRFVELWNRRDFEALAGILSPDHRLHPAPGEVVEGAEPANAALREYTASWPDVQVHIAEAFWTGATISFLARTTHSCDGVPPGEEIRRLRVYVAEIAGGRVAAFHHLDDTEEVRRAWGIHPESQVT